MIILYAQWAMRKASLEEEPDFDSWASRRYTTTTRLNLFYVRKFVLCSITHKITGRVRLQWFSKKSKSVFGEIFENDFEYFEIDDQQFNLK